MSFQKQGKTWKTITNCFLQQINTRPFEIQMAIRCFGQVSISAGVFASEQENIPNLSQDSRVIHVLRNIQSWFLRLLHAEMSNYSNHISVNYSTNKSPEHYSFAEISFKLIGRTHKGIVFPKKVLALGWNQRITTFYLTWISSSIKHLLPLGVKYALS